MIIFKNILMIIVMNILMVITNHQVEGQQEFIIEAADVSEMRCWLIAIQAGVSSILMRIIHFYQEHNNHDYWLRQELFMKPCAKRDPVHCFDSAQHSLKILTILKMQQRATRTMHATNKQP